MTGGLADVTFLGTGSAVPSARRWLPSILVRLRGEYLLLDCGEGAQYRVLRAGLRVNKLVAVLVTHLHGDHVYGLPGLLESLGMWGRSRCLEVWGPRGLKEYLEAALARGEVEYPLKIGEVEPGVVLSREGYEVVAVPVEHKVEAYAYVIVERDLPGKFNERKAEELGIPPSPLRRMLIQGLPIKLPDGRIVTPQDVVGPPRKGLKIVYSGDTMPCEALVEAASRADLLIHDATFASEHKEEAEASGHSTAAEAAECAAKARVKLLFLFHYSNRYSDLSGLLVEARKIFRRSYLSEDLLRITLRRWGTDSLMVSLSKLGG
ncbi:MAG: ribonuclease Z [Thermoproteales archaeon]|nr:ribonuclease Z [Thermoproteales archaeon]